MNKLFVKFIRLFQLSDFDWPALDATTCNTAILCEYTFWRSCAGFSRHNLKIIFSSLSQFFFFRKKSKIWQLSKIARTAHHAIETSCDSCPIKDVHFLGHSSKFLNLGEGEKKKRKIENISIRRLYKLHPLVQIIFVMTGSWHHHLVRSSRDRCELSHCQDPWQWTFFILLELRASWKSPGYWYAKLDTLFYCCFALLAAPEGNVMCLLN